MICWAGAPAAIAAQPSNTVCHNRSLLGGTYGDVEVTAGGWCLIGAAKVTGNVTAIGAASIGIWGDASIAGNVEAIGTTSNPNATGQLGGGTANFICTSRIAGNVDIERSGVHAAWNIGSRNYPPLANDANCLRHDSLGGDVSFVNNAGTPNEISGNQIGGNLECAGNAPFTRGFIFQFVSNQVTGRTSGQCAAFG